MIPPKEKKDVMIPPKGRGPNGGPESKFHRYKGINQQATKMMATGKKEEKTVLYCCFFCFFWVGLLGGLFRLSSSHLFDCFPRLLNSSLIDFVFSTLVSFLDPL